VHPLYQPVAAESGASRPASAFGGPRGGCAHGLAGYTAALPWTGLQSGRDRATDSIGPSARLLLAADENAEDALAVWAGEPDLDDGVKADPLAVVTLAHTSTPETESSAITITILGSQRTKRSSENVSVSSLLPRMTFGSHRVTPLGSTTSNPM